MVIQFQAVIEKFNKKGEKSGWTYIEVPNELAAQLDGGNKKTFRVKGSLDGITIEAMSLTPMGEGIFILALNASLRKKINKAPGNTLEVILEKDKIDPPLSHLLLDCIKEDKSALSHFNSLPKSHQRYFSNWVESAKTDQTKAKRIAQALQGLAAGMGFGEMIRFYKNLKE